MSLIALLLFYIISKLSDFAKKIKDSLFIYLTMCNLDV